jgi:hypothetical protein
LKFNFITNKNIMISGIKDIDREILGKLDDRELLKACSIDSYTWNTVCDDAFLRRRLLTKYPEIEQYKLQRESWKQFFLRTIYYISKMKEQYKYEYTFGDFVSQYSLLSRYIYNKNTLFIQSAKEGELAIVIWSLKNGASIHVLEDLALLEASQEGRTEIVKYLVESGSNIHAGSERALRSASYHGQLEVVKYLVEHGADIRAKNGAALTYAINNRHLEVVKYLKSKM